MNIERAAATIAESQKTVKGNCDVVGRKLPVSLTDPDFATFEADQVYNQADATGFIRLNALRLRIRALAGKRTLA